jgi:homogentisate 1,2-dioxygenase
MAAATSTSSAGPFAGASARGPVTSIPTASDPYTYQLGFGNRFATEALPGTLPSYNTPQKCKYELFSEQLNGTPFVSPRASQLHAWFYRIQPSVVRKPCKKMDATDIEASFSPQNPNVEFTPQDYGWDQFLLPSESNEVDFVEGLKTIAGHGDPTNKEGLAVHMYMANASMKKRKRAFSNSDGDMLILPQEGRLDIQTEFGKLMVRPGELVVVPAGIKFSVDLPDGVGRGYIQEVYGSHYELPELGPVGANGMAQPRDFEVPVAAFDIDRSTWEVVVKLVGKLFAYEKPSTPFDVVAWHGNYVPYKYAMEKFIASATVDREQSDPSIYCVLTARSKIPGVALSDFLVFTPKWCVTRNTFRPPYYHRNVATELMGMMYGTWSGTGTQLSPGGLTYEPSYMPHGESFERWKEATSADLQPIRIGEGVMAFMFHISAHVSLTRYALERTGVLQPIQEDLWQDFQPEFLKHLDQVNQDLAAAGLPEMATLNGHVTKTNGEVHVAQK